MKNTIFAIVAVLSLFTPGSYVHAAGLKKVLVLDFTNLENNASYQYMEVSITDAVKKKLKQNFAFKETPREKWESVAKANYLFKEDFHTRSTAMNLGLLARQDVVIAGNYKIIAGKVKKKKKAAADDATEQGVNTAIIMTQVRILDITNKITLSDFIIKGYADARIWDSVKEISDRITDETRKILPGKEEWSKAGIVEEEPSEPLFTKPVMGLRVGGGMYVSGYADRMQADLPAFKFMLRGNLPFLYKRLSLGGQFQYVKHSWKKDFNEITRNMKIDTGNYLTGLMFGLDFIIFNSFSIHPEIGGGVVFQSTMITGATSQSTQNSFPYAGGGLEFAYRINPLLEAALEISSAAEFETGTLTYLNTATIGVNLRL